MVTGIQDLGPTDSSLVGTGGCFTGVEWVIKVKKTLSRPGQALRVPGGLRLPYYKTAH